MSSSSRGSTKYFFTDDYPVDPKARDKVMSKGDPKARLRELMAALETADFSSEASLEAMLQALAQQHNLGVGDYIHPGRLAVSGTNIGPSFYGLFHVLGREKVKARIERFLKSSE